MAPSVGCPTSSWVRPLRKFLGRDSAVGTGALGLEGTAGGHAIAPAQGEDEIDHSTEAVCDLLVV